MPLIRFLFFIIIATLAAYFAVLNRENVYVIWSPVHDAIDIPVFLIALIAIFSGFIIGALYSWLGNSNLRKNYRSQKKQIKTLEKEIEKHVRNNQEIRSEIEENN